MADHLNMTNDYENQKEHILHSSLNLCSSLIFNINPKTDWNRKILYFPVLSAEILI